jgi:hypothetical protein
MAYTPNPDREVVNGKAKVSAKELADFQKQYGNDKTLRDLLNMDKGLVRRKDPGENSKKAEDIQSSTDALPSMSRQSGPPKAGFVGGIKSNDQSSWDSGDQSGGVKPKNRSNWDSTFGEDAESGFERAKRGESFTDNVLMGAGKLAIAAYPVGRALSAVRPVVGAAVKRAVQEDVPEAPFARNDNQSFNPEKMVDRSRPEPAFNPDKMVDRSRPEPKFNPDKITGRDQPDPMKKGGAVKQYAKGGKINLADCKVNTTPKNKSSSKW